MGRPLEMRKFLDCKEQLILTNTRRGRNVASRQACSARADTPAGASMTFSDTINPSVSCVN